MKRRILLAMVAVLVAGHLFANTLYVGRTRSLQAPSDAAAVAKDGDVVIFDGDAYSDCALWTQNNLTLQAGTSGVVHVRDAVYGQKAIWVIQGNNVTVQNIEFSDVTDPTTSNKNYAGIRAEGTNLTIRNCYFHDMDDGILAGANTESTITIENSEFVHNGWGDGLSHNIYIGNIKQFNLTGCNVHGAYIGHNVKSRALSNYIAYNRIMDETDSTSRDIDLPNGGFAAIVGNVIEKGLKAANGNIIGYAEEGNPNPSQTLILVNNTIENDRSNGGTWFFFPASTKIDSLVLYNNIFVGPGTFISGAAPTTIDSVTNVRTPNGTAIGLTDVTTYNYHLTASSPMRDQATTTGLPYGSAYLPTLQYAIPQHTVTRPTVGALDLGAFEYNPNSAVGEPVRIPPPDVAIDIFPNPATTSTTLSYLSNGAARLEIFNAYGMKIANPMVETMDGAWRHVQLASAALPAGTYFARVLSGTSVSVKAFVVVK